MRLSGRVKSLERRVGAGAVCRVCGGRGHPGIAMVINGAEHSRSGGCLRCGLLSCLKRIILNYGTDAEAEEARAAWPPAGAPR